MREMAQKPAKVTDFKIRDWTPGTSWETGEPCTQRQEIALGSGLYLVLEISGKRRFSTRCRFKGTSINYPLGDWAMVGDGLTINKATAAHATAKEAFKNGIDLREQRKEAKTEAKAAAADTVQAVAELWIAEQRAEEHPIVSLDVREKQLQRYVYPDLGKKPIGEVKRSDLMALLKKLKAKSGFRTSQVVYTILKKMFSWYALSNDNFVVPFVQDMWSTKQRKRIRKFTDDEIRKIWRAAELSGTYGRLIQFLILTGARLKEAAHMEWSELQAPNAHPILARNNAGGARGTNSVWVLPAKAALDRRNKPANIARTAGKAWEHIDIIRPLSTKALDIVGKGSKSSKWVFSIDGRCIKQFSDPKVLFDKKCKIWTPWVVHDLRSLSRSLMSRAKISRDHAEAALGHISPDSYDRHEYLMEKNEAFEKIAALLTDILNSGEVVDLDSKRA
jgi:integrase